MFVKIVDTERRWTRCAMNDAETGQAEIREVESSSRNTAATTPMRTPRALGLGAIAFGAFALGATAIGALAIGRLAVGAFAMKRGRVRTLTVDDLEVRRLHIGELIIDSGMPR
jgi:anti-sigma factor RsiW